MSIVFIVIAKLVLVKLKIIDTTFVNAKWIHAPVALGASRRGII